MKPKNQTRAGAIEIVEQGFHLLRTAPPSFFLTYYLGTVPFLLGLLFFWSDMSRGAFADERLAIETAGLTLLFIWMKTWQALFARQLHGKMAGRTKPRLTGRKLLSAAVAQSILQPSGLFLIPVALVLLLPIGWVYSFYQNVTAFGGFEEGRSVFGKALRNCLLWPRQNNYIVLLFKGFGFFVFLNLFAGIAAVPFLLATLLGIETVFVQTPWTFLNSTFFAAIGVVTYLCVDPWVKAVYVVRCFYGESRQTGEDLRMELRSYVEPLPGAVAIMTISAGLFFGSVLSGMGAEGTRDGLPSDPGRVNAGAAPVKAAELNSSIEHILQQPEYSWRLPREKRVERKPKGVIAAAIDSLIEVLKDWGKTVKSWLDQLVKWLNRRAPTNTTGGSGLALDWLFGIRGLVALLLVIIFGLFLFLLFRLWRQRETSGEELSAEPVVALPNLADEQVAADQLPEDGWITMGRELLARGDLRLALRAFYLASLAHLAQRNLVTIARHKSNRDYERELGRRAHAIPEVTSTFTENVSIFDRSWYGRHEVNQAVLEQFQRNVEKINAA